MLLAEITNQPGLDLLLLWLDILLATVGVLLLVKSVMVGDLQFARLSAWTERPNHLWPEWIIVPLLLYVLLLLLLQPVEKEIVLSEMSMEQQGRFLGIDLLCRLGVLLVAVGLAHRKFPGGWRAFLFGQQRLSRQVWYGVLGLAMAFPLVWGVSEISLLVMHWCSKQAELPEHPVLELLGDKRTPRLIWLALWGSAVVVTPLVEEVFFRGYCQTGLNHLFRRPWISITVVALFFGLAHAQQPQAVAPLMVLGAALGYLYERSGGLLASVVLHVLFNLKTMIFFSLGATTN
ncbi:MAG: hypothetical protein HJJLKODD_02072 [Phycisphaerae bacterium]|nr:hypothetical protein [Phycisphaerae bacterium]